MNMLDWNTRVLCTHNSLSVATVPDHILIKTLWVKLRSTKNWFRSIHVICVAYSSLQLLPWWDTWKAFMKKTVIIWKSLTVKFVGTFSPWPCFREWSVTYSNKSFILYIFHFGEGFAPSKKFHCEPVERNLLEKTI